MIIHPQTAGFIEALKTELRALRNKQTWKEIPGSEVDIKSAAVVVSTMFISKH